MSQATKPPVSSTFSASNQDGDRTQSLSRWLATRERLIVGLLLLAAIAFNLYYLYPEVSIHVPDLNDGVLHRLGVERVVTALFLGQDPTDPWLGSVTLGYPLFHYYQHLSYLPPAVLHLLSLGRLPLPDIFNWTRYLLLSFFPLSIYWSMRRFGFDDLPAALSGLVASLLATNGLYGFDFNSYIWGGFGLYTQLWGMFLLPPALGQSYLTLKEGRGYVWSTLLLATTLLSHLLLGYITLVSVGLFVLIAPDWTVRWQRFRRLILLLALVALVTAYFWLPFLLDNSYLNRSIWENRGKYDSYGYAWVLGALFRGEIFDFGRWPILTILAGIGLALCLWRWREERYRVPVALFVVWLLLYFGRPTWGVLLGLLPMSRDLHLHRLVAGVHLGGIYLMGLALALPWQWVLPRRDIRYLLAPVVVTVLLMIPVYRERANYLAQNRRWMLESQSTIAAEQQEFDALLDTLAQLPPGRVYAGLAATWGKEYKIGAVPVYALINSAGFDMLGYLYHALSLNADIQVLFDESRPEQYNLFNVRYVVAPRERTFPDFVHPIRDFGRHRLYQVETTGYFDLVGSDLAFNGSKFDFYSAASYWLGSNLPGMKQHPTLFLDEVANINRPTLPLSEAGDVMSHTSFQTEPNRGRIVSERIESNAYLAQIEVERESMLVLKATYHPNWQVTVDGVVADTVMVMPSFIGVKVSPGAHDVRLTYQPRSLRHILLIIGLLALPLIAIAEWRRENLEKLAKQLNLGRIPASVGYAIPQHFVFRSELSAHLPYLGGLALLTLLAGLPLFQFKIMSGHDALGYLPRAIEFYRGLNAGQLFPRWAPDLSGGYGQPFFNFNPPLFYYLSAFFHVLGFSFVAAQNLAIFVLLLLAALGMYFLAGEVFGRQGGLVSAVAYLFAPYLQATLYVRHALADFAAFAFIPLAFWGLYRFAKGRHYRFLVVGALSVALLLLSSNPVALITFPVFLLILGWLTYSERRWSILLRGLWCLGLGLGLAAFFWLPALLERDLVQTSRLLAGYLNYGNHFVYAYQFILSPWGYGLSLPGPVDGMSFATGPIHLLLTVAAFLFIRRIYRASNAGGVLVSFFLVLFLLAIFFASSASLFLWEQLPLLQYLEFPWRFLSLVSISTAFVCGSLFSLLAPEERGLANALAAVLILGLFLFGFAQAQPETFLEISEADYSPHAIASRGIAVTTAREYEPIWVREAPQAPATERLTFLEGQGQVTVSWLTPVYYEFNVEVVETALLQANTFYFPGWTLSVDGVERPVAVSNPQGAMVFSLGPGQHLVQLRFKDTPVRLWSIWLSLLTLLLLLLAPKLRNPFK